jgi:hypothetical protein
MSDAFVPFSKNRGKPGAGADSFRLTIIPHSQPAAAFQPLTTPTSITPPSTGTKEPQVTIEREGDRITRIKIQCSCGQLIELNCAY